MHETSRIDSILSITFVSLSLICAIQVSCNKPSATTQRSSSDRCCTDASKANRSVALLSSLAPPSLPKEAKSFYQQLFDEWETQVTRDWKIPKSLILSLRLQEENRFYHFCLEERFLGTNVSFVHYSHSVGISGPMTISIGSEYPLYAVLRPDNRYVMSNRLALYIIEAETIEAVFIAADQVASRLHVDVALCTHSPRVLFDMDSVLKRKRDISNELSRLFLNAASAKNNHVKKCFYELISYRTWELASYLRLIYLLSVSSFPAPIQFDIVFHAPNYSDLVSAINKLRKDPRTFEAEMMPYGLVSGHSQDWDIYKNAWSIYECKNDPL